MLHFILSHIGTIALALWLFLFCVLAMHFVRPAILKNIHFGGIAGALIASHIFYGIFISWGQYHVWATSSDFTRSLLTSPLPPEAPLPSVLEWSRSYFNHSLGYFVYYAFGRIWLPIVELLVVSGLFYSILKLWNHYRGRFLPQGPEIILALLLVASFPGAIVLVFLGFLFAFVWFGISAGATYYNDRTLNIPRVYVERAFILATPISLIFGNLILKNFLHFLYVVIY